MTISNLFSSKLNTPETIETTEKTNYLGFCFGLTHGLGFTYRKLMNNTAVQTSILPYISDNTEGEYIDKLSLFAGGLTLLQRLNKGKYGSLYVSAGVAGIRRIQENKQRPYTNNVIDTNETPPKSHTETIVPELTTITLTGIGVGPAIGMEFNFAENFTLSIELPIAFIFKKESNSANNFKDENLKFKSIWPIPNISLLYKF